MSLHPRRLRLAGATAIAVALPIAASFSVVTGGPDNDRGVFVSPTRDGGYVAVGVTSSAGAGKEDVYLVRTDASGEIRWTRTHGGPGTDMGWAVHETTEGLVIAGFTDSVGAGDFDCTLIAADAEGHARWSRTYGGGGRDRCWAVMPAGDGGYVLAGETTSAGRGAEDCYLIRTDASGKEVWSRTFGGEQGDRCFSIAGTGDGGYLLAGQTFSEGAGDRDVYLVRTDATGAALWSRTFGGAASDVGHSVARLAGGDLLVTGYTSSFAEAGDDPYLIRIGEAGDVRWTRVIPLAGVTHTLTGEQTADGGFLLGGFSDGRATGTGPMAAILIKTDPDGRLTWQRDFLPTTTGETFGYTARATPDGGGILTGHTTVGSAGGLDLFLIKVDNNGR